MKTIITVLAALLLSGCVGITPKYTPEEYEAITTRTYTGKTKDQIFSASRLIFETADPDNFKVTRFGGELRATRWRFIFLNAMTWEWRVLPESDDRKMKVSVNSISKMDSTEAGNLTGRAIYGLFFGRLDYLLGERATWPTCADAEKQIYVEKHRGDVSALCYGASDEAPPRIMATSGPPPK